MIVGLLALGAHAVLARAEGADGSAESRSETLWLEVFDAKGRPVQGLEPGDLEVIEGSETLAPLSLEPSGAPGSVLYFEQTLAGRGGLLRAAQALSTLAPELGSRGEVRLVVADPEPEEVLTTRDPLALTERLSWLATRDTGRGRILELRQETLERLASGSAADTASGVETVRAAIGEEAELVRSQQRRLLAWAASDPERRPGPLFLVMEGYDLDPLSFYLQHLPEAAAAELLRGASRLPTLEAVATETARGLAALGWTVLPVSLADASAAARERVPDPIEVQDPRGGTTTMGGLRLGELLRRRKEKREAREAAAEGALPQAELVAPREPLLALASASGGEVLASETALAEGLRRLGERLELRYLSRAPADELREVEVRALRPGLQVRARRWVSHGTPRAVAAARLESLLEGGESAGGLDVGAALRVSGGELAGVSEGATAELEARVSLRPLAGEGEVGQQGLLVTVATSLRGEEPRLERTIVAPGSLEGKADWTYRSSLELPSTARRVAVLVEELGGGRWGGSLASVLESRRAGAEEALPAPPVVELLRPDEKLLRGKVKFELEVYDPSVARVAYLLEDREVAERRASPYAARVDLGRSPRRQTLTAVAYDAEGRELGRDSVVLNAGAGGFAVRLIEPAVLEGTGPVDVEADVAVPAGRRLDRLLFFWNNEPVATLYRPPFRQRILVPETEPVGYIRAVAMLDDGSVVEDVVFMNGPAAGERLEVRLVELNVVVTDPSGRPVRGLGREDFRIREEGRPQEVAAFSDADDLPITLGMAIDSSASMFVKLPLVQQAAQRFLDSTLAERDRAFVVDFDSQPRLARGTTGELDRVVRAIDRLEAGGSTALWESIVFSLVQLQGVRGRKALVVFSDGADEDEEFPFRSCMSFAKKMGVPIYLILMRHEPKEKSGLSLWTRSFGSRVERLMAAVGGRVFYAKDYPDLDQVYDEIEEELRSQYLLAYYPEEVGVDDAWRDVDIEVTRRGLKPRTLRGYWP